MSEKTPHEENQDWREHGKRKQKQKQAYDDQFQSFRSRRWRHRYRGSRPSTSSSLTASQSDVTKPSQQLEVVDQQKPISTFGPIARPRSEMSGVLETLHTTIEAAFRLNHVVTSSSSDSCIDRQARSSDGHVEKSFDQSGSYWSHEFSSEEVSSSCHTNKSSKNIWSITPEAIQLLRTQSSIAQPIEKQNENPDLNVFHYAIKSIPIPVRTPSPLIPQE